MQDNKRKDDMSPFLGTISRELFSPFCCFKDNSQNGRSIYLDIFFLLKSNAMRMLPLVEAI